MQSSPQDPLTRFLPKTAHWALSQGGNNVSHWKWKRQGEVKSFFYFPSSFTICIGKWDVNASFDVSKSFVRSLSGRGTWVGWVESGRSIAAVLLVRPNKMLYSVKVKHQLRRRLSDRCSVFSCSSPRLLLLSTSPPFLYLSKLPPPQLHLLTPVTNHPSSHAPPWILSDPQHLQLSVGGFKPHRGNQHWGKKSSWPLTPAPLEHRNV